MLTVAFLLGVAALIIELDCQAACLLWSGFVPDVLLYLR
jgi:hypothetical protein